MDYTHGKMRKNVEEGDRLSSLPDDLIHKILSFIGTREAISISVLSSRWRFIWTSLPHLDFSFEDDFDTLPMFSKYVTNVLSRRDNQTDLYSMKLTIRVKESLLFFKRVLKYAFSHNIQQLDVFFVLEKPIDALLPLFSSQSLKHLTLTMHFEQAYHRWYTFDGCFVSTSGLLSLTTLDLRCITFYNADYCSSLFSKCANLKNLSLRDFNPVNSNSLSIIHPRLSNLTLECIHLIEVVNIDAPQLKNLTIRSCNTKFVISAPVLASLLYKGVSPLSLSSEGFRSLEKADICFPCTQDMDIHGIVCLLQLLRNVKYLTLNLGMFELLSSSMDLILQQPSPFMNLKSLKIFPETKGSLEQAPKKVTIISNEVKSYLLGGSPGSTLTMVLHEEIQEKQAQKLIAELRVCLEKENDNSETYRAHLEQGKTPVESMAQIKNGWEDLVERIQRRKETVCLIISKLQSIEEIVTKLPASNRAKIQPSFSSLCAEVDITVSMITGSVKIQCDENQSRSSVCFQKLATTLEPFC